MQRVGISKFADSSANKIVDVDAQGIHWQFFQDFDRVELIADVLHEHDQQSVELFEIRPFNLFGHSSKQPVDYVPNPRTVFIVFNWHKHQHLSQDRSLV